MDAKRRRRNHRPAMENLEGRQLLNGDHLGINEKDLTRLRAVVANGVPLRYRRFEYTTPQGAQVVLTLYGSGSLRGTTIDRDGVLDLVYNGTTAGSRITAHVVGGPGFALLRTVRDADVAPYSPGITNADPLGNFNMRKFRLVNDGYVSLTGGVGFVRLDRIGRGATLQLNELPAQGATTTTSTSLNVELIETTPPVAGTTTSFVAVNTFATTTTETTITGTNLLVQQVGVDVTPRRGEPIRHGTSPVNPDRPLGLPQVVTVDVTPGQTPSLVWFDVDQSPQPVSASISPIPITRGVEVRRIPLANLADANPAVSVGRTQGRQVVLVSDNTRQVIEAYDAITGVSRGAFGFANLAMLGLIRVDGLGSTDTLTTLQQNANPLATDATRLGTVVRIDVTQSLAGGVAQAVPIGNPFNPTREFELTGGAAGLAGTELIVAGGAGFFDTAQPNRKQLGTLGLSVGRGTTTGTNPSNYDFIYSGITEVDRRGFPGNIDAGPADMRSATPYAGIGSVDRFLAYLVTPTTDPSPTPVTNPILVLRDPTTDAVSDRVVLLNQAGTRYTGTLSGLSESFHPELEDTVIVNVLGVFKLFQARQAQDMVINSLGILDTISIHLAKNVGAVGRPIRNVNIPNRVQPVQLISTARGENGDDTQGQVVVIPNLRPVGPLANPDKGPLAVNPPQT